jgi:hypothetical protein
MRGRALNLMPHSSVIVVGREIRHATIIVIPRHLGASSLQAPNYRQETYGEP